MLVVWNIGNWSPICSSKIGNGNSLKRNEKALIPHKILFHGGVHSVASPPLKAPDKNVLSITISIQCVYFRNGYDHWPLAIQLKDYHQRFKTAKNEEKI